MIRFRGDQQLYPTLLLRDKQFGQRAGLDMEKMLSVISKGAAQSWQMENRWKTMCEVQACGGGRWDTSSLINLLAED